MNTIITRTMLSPLQEKVFQTCITGMPYNEDDYKQIIQECATLNAIECRKHIAAFQS